MTNAVAAVAADAAGTASGGLRLRKRERTRRAISDAGFRLFDERGFDAVKLTEIAAAADVAPATVFTHFDSKEDIFFSRRDEFNAALSDVVGRAATGPDLLARLRDYLITSCDMALSEEWLDNSRTFARILLESRALRRSYLPIQEHRRLLLARLLIERAGDRADTVELTLLAGLTTAVRTAAFETLHAELAAGQPVEQIRTRVHDIVDRGFTRLAAAYGTDSLLGPGRPLDNAGDTGDVRLE